MQKKKLPKKSGSQWQTQENENRLKEYSKKIEQERRMKEGRRALEWFKRQQQVDINKNDSITRIHNVILNKNAINYFSPLYVEIRIKTQLIQKKEKYTTKASGNNQK